MGDVGGESMEGTEGRADGAGQLIHEENKVKGDPNILKWKMMANVLKQTTKQLLK